MLQKHFIIHILTHLIATSKGNSSNGYGVSDGLPTTAVDLSFFLTEVLLSRFEDPCELRSHQALLMVCEELLKVVH